MAEKTISPRTRVLWSTLPFAFAIGLVHLGIGYLSNNVLQIPLAYSFGLPSAFFSWLAISALGFGLGRLIRPQAAKSEKFYDYRPIFLIALLVPLLSGLTAILRPPVLAEQTFLIACALIWGLPALLSLWRGLPYPIFAALIIVGISAASNETMLQMGVQLDTLAQNNYWSLIASYVVAPVLGLIVLNFVMPFSWWLFVLRYGVDGNNPMAIFEFIPKIAIEALGELKNPNALDALIAELKLEQKDSNFDLWMTRYNVSEALGKIGGDAAIKALVALLELDILHLKGGIDSLRYPAMQALDKIGWIPANADEMLLHSLAGERWDEVPYFGAAAAERLLTALITRGGMRSPNYLEALRAYAEIAGQAALEKLAGGEGLEKVHEQRQQEIIGAAKTVLAKLQEKSEAKDTEGKAITDAAELTELLSQIKSKDYETRTKAAKILGHPGNKEAVASLAAILKDRNSEADALVVALGNIGGDEAAEAVLSAFNRSYLAPEALIKLRAKKAVPLVLDESLRTLDGKSYLSPYWIDLLAELGDTETAPKMLPLLAYKSTETQKKVAEAIGKLGDAQTAKLILEYMVAHPEINFPAVHALENLLKRCASEIPGELLLLMGLLSKLPAVKWNSAYGGQEGEASIFEFTPTFMRWLAAMELGKRAANAA